jgi:hypothetical protein
MENDKICGLDWDLVGSDIVYVMCHPIWTQVCGLDWDLVGSDIVYVMCHPIWTQV